MNIGFFQILPKCLVKSCGSDYLCQVNLYFLYNLAKETM